jgi:hypothetical protein
MRRVGFGVVLLLIGCSLGCTPAQGGSTPKAGGGAAPRVPSVHRAQAQACPSSRGPGAATETNGACSKDADCKAGKNGRCDSHSSGGGRLPPSNQCSYDNCFVDADCGQGALCACGHDDNTAGPGHVCLPANCRTDGECGPGRFCSPSPTLCSRGYTPDHYFCHGSSDECVNDSDCPPPAQKGYGPISTRCVYSPEVGHWACATQECPVG